MDRWTVARAKQTSEVGFSLWAQGCVWSERASLSACVPRRDPKGGQNQQHNHVSSSLFVMNEKEADTNTRKETRVSADYNVWLSLLLETARRRRTATAANELARILDIL